MFIRKSTREAVKTLLEKFNFKDAAVFVVEGKKDEAALKHLVNADFFLLNNQNCETQFWNVDTICLHNNKKSLYESAEDIASHYTEVMLMLDADKKGIELRKKMTSYLQQNGVRISHEGQELLKLARCRNVEDLSSLEL